MINAHFAVDTNLAAFVDGSGLSRYNNIQPIALLELLKKGFAIPEFVNALPAPGEEDSTLKNRLLLSSNIIAKTGGMSRINCLCGYILAGPKTRAFVFMANSFSPPTQDLTDLMDTFISKKL